MTIREGIYPPFFMRIELCRNYEDEKSQRQQWKRVVIYKYGKARQKGIGTMNERITKQMVEDGLWQDVIKIRCEDMNEFIVTIGDNWFYYGGQDSDWRNASSIFDLVADGIFETLEGFRDGWDFYGDEYLYYYYYLTENIR